MKSINIRELVKIFRDKVGINFETDNFEDFKHFIDDSYFQFKYEEWGYYPKYMPDALESYEMIFPYAMLEGNTKIIKSIFNELKESYGFTEECCYGLEEDGYDYHDSLEAVNTENIHIEALDQNISTKSTLEHLKKVSLEKQCEFVYSFSMDGEINEVFVDNKQIDTNYIEWTIKNGEIIDKKTKFTIIDDDGKNLFILLDWLCLAFYFDTFEEFDSLDIDLRYEQVAKKELRGENGRLFMLQYKYDNKDNILSTYEDSLRLVEKYPIIYSVIKEEYKDERMNQTLIDANNKYREEYDKRKLEAEEKGEYLYYTDLEINSFLFDKIVWNKNKKGIKFKYY